MTRTSLPIHSPAPAPDGPIACTLPLNEYAGRLADWRQRVFSRLVGMQRPEPTRLRLILPADTDPETVRDLLLSEQGCCAFLSFTLTRAEGRLVADLEVPDEAAPTVDAMVGLAQLAAPGVAS